MKHLIAIAVVLAAIATAGSAGAATILVDNFESYTPGAPTPSLGTWSVTQGNVDVIPVGGSYNWCGSQCIDLNGTGGPNPAARIEHTVALVAGQAYALSFDYGVNQNSGVPETLGFGVINSTLASQFIAMVIPTSTMTSVLYNFVALVTGNAVLFFQDMDVKPGDQGGPLLDNVLLASVPLPAGIPLLGGALALLGVLGWRNKKQAQTLA